MVMQYENRGSMPKDETIERLVETSGLLREVLVNVKIKRADLPAFDKKLAQFIENFRADPESYKDLSKDEIQDLINTGALPAEMPLEPVKLSKPKQVITFGKEPFTRLVAEEYAGAYGKWRGVPMYNTPVTASFIETYRDENFFQPTYYLHDPRFKDCKFGAIITGDSMHSEIRHGDHVVCQEITDWRFVVYGDIYYIVSTNGLETCKYLNADPHDANNFLLVPRNEAISPSPIPKDMILKMYKVRGVVRGY
jgi:SOS-response transcriptional repressor LexA